MSTDGKDKQPWDETTEAKDMMQTDGILMLDTNLFSEQANGLRQQPEAVTRATRRLFMKWFTGLPLELGVTEERRDTKLQPRFKQELVEAYGTAHAEPGRNDIWYPALAKYIDKCAVKAVHIFGHALEQDLMTGIWR
ncbi:hypothetical protein MMC29_001580 [Sticta canariensis]|nr:hypothetical protein [Sticta canariensis]